MRTSIEVRRYYGGRAPVALLGASFTPSEIGQCELAVGHTDEDWPTPERWANRQLVGLLGQPLCAGLTVPFARAALHGLMHAPADMPAGRLEVRAGAFDVESSEAMFKLAGDLLRHAVARLAVGEACAAQDLLRMAMDHP